MINRHAVLTGLNLLLIVVTGIPVSYADRYGLLRTQLDYESKLVDATLARNGSVYPDVSLQKYTQSVLRRVFPSLSRKFRLRLIRNTSLNAYALPNGTIYITTGFIARLDNEAQLAIVLAHEGAHFIREHGLLQRMKLKSSFTRRGILKYSRKLELEADRLAFAYVARAGYSMSAATSVFARLVKEKKATPGSGSSSSSSVSVSGGYYPKLIQRQQHYQSLLTGKRHSRGDTGAARFLKHTRRLRAMDVQTRLGRGDFTTTWSILFAKTAGPGFGNHIHYYRAQYYNLRGNTGDSRKVLALGQQSVRAAPRFAPAWRLLGEWHLKRADYARAQHYFRHYLRLSPSRRYRRYVQYYLEQIRRQRSGKK